MFEKISNVKIISSIKNKSKPRGSTQDRKTHGFLFRLDGYTEYIINGEVFRASKGEVAFLPKGCCYDYVSQNSTYVSINFEADIENPKLSVYSLKDFVGAYSTFLSFPEMWNFGNQADKYKCLANFYDMLSYISKLDNIKNSEKDKYRALEPAIKYLKNHIYDTELRIEELHILCGISDTYFRKLFISKYAMPPQKYVTKERLSRARLIIESGDYENISSVSEIVGYSDPLYFSKAFKKQYGLPPSNIWE